MKKIILITLLCSLQSFGQYSFEQFSTYTGSLSGGAKYYTIFNNELYFNAASTPSTSNFELWKTNGTQTGTTQVSDIVPGFEGSSPFSFQEFNGYLYFTAYSSTTGRELYRTDGTTTTLFKEINVGSGSGFDLSADRHKFIVLNNKMYFFARDIAGSYDLWRTDGTTTGTQKMVEVNGFGLGDKDRFIEVNGELFFVMDDDNENTIGSELYKYNETTNTVTLVKDINPNNGTTSGVHITSLTKFDNKLFFSANNGISNRLYVSDGTENGTFIVENTTPLNYLQPRKLFVFNNELYFIAFKIGAGQDLLKCKKNNNIYELEVVYDTNATGNPALNPFNFFGLNDYCIYNNELYFVAREQSAPNNGSIYQIYKTNGVGAQIAFSISTANVGNTSGNDIHNFIIYDNKLFFMMTGINMPEPQLWVANFVDGSISRLTNYGGPDTQPQGLRADRAPIIYNNNLYFSGFTSTNGEELWKLSSSDLSVNQNVISENHKIYPNPTSNFLNIEMEHTANFKIEIYDVLGKKVASFLNQKKVDISDLNNGMYIVRTINLENDLSQSQKIIKQ
jgi:ELWxxDGT repeat protein